mmetsp:Transcript_7759/g.20516  ORF Transcript_7759/g.20516 Transcript_7759/m.20516 type:complete len:361 (+) Transcript_7759:53-1135(+)
MLAARVEAVPPKCWRRVRSAGGWRDCHAGGDVRARLEVVIECAMAAFVVPPVEVGAKRTSPDCVRGAGRTHCPHGGTAGATEGCMSAKRAVVDPSHKAQAHAVDSLIRQIENCRAASVRNLPIALNYAHKIKAHDYGDADEDAVIQDARAGNIFVAVTGIPPAVEHNSRVRAAIRRWSNFSWHRPSLQQILEFDGKVLAPSDRELAVRLQRAREEKKLVMLSPEGEELLESVKEEEVYVLGGLIDRTHVSGISLNYGRACGLRTARLPILEAFQNENPPTSHDNTCELREYSQTKTILNIDTVFTALSWQPHNLAEWCEVWSSPPWVGSSVATLLPPRIVRRHKALQRAISRAFSKKSPS